MLGTAKPLGGRTHLAIEPAPKWVLTPHAMCGIISPRWWFDRKCGRIHS